MSSKIDLKLNDKVYYPSKTNDILSVGHTSDDDYPIKLNKYPTTFLPNGLEFTLDENPSIFPVTIEWYNILKNVYPDLKPPTTNVRVLLTKTITQYYEIEVEESDPNVASNIARKMLEDSVEGFKLIGTDSRISLREWENKND
jgi:hypothetical protein